MHAIDRLSGRLRHADVTLSERQAHAIACYIYDEYLPSQLLGMAGAADYLGLASSNTLSMRLGRGHDLLIVAHLPKDRLTTRDACDAYLEIHPKGEAASDDMSQEARLQRNREQLRKAAS